MFSILPFFFKVQSVIFNSPVFTVIFAEWFGSAVSPSYCKTCVMATFKDDWSLHESGLSTDRPSGTSVLWSQQCPVAEMLSFTSLFCFNRWVPVSKCSSTLGHVLIKWNWWNRAIYIYLVALHSILKCSSTFHHWEECKAPYQNEMNKRSNE